MEQEIDVLFGRSYTNPSTIVVEQAIKVGYYKDEEDNEIGPIYSSEVETWLARTDMSCSIYTVPKSNFSVLTQKYTEFVKATWENPSNKQKIEHLKQEFLQIANS